MKSKSYKFVTSFLLFSFLFTTTSFHLHAYQIRGHGLLSLQQNNKHLHFVFAATLSENSSHLELLDDFGNSLLITDGHLNYAYLKKMGIKINQTELTQILLYENEPSEMKSKNILIRPESKKSKWIANLSNFKTLSTDKNLAKRSNQDKTPSLPYKVEIQSKKATLLISWEHIEFMP